MLSTPQDDARAAFGNAELSATIHHAKTVQDESYNVESRTHSTLLNRALIFAGLHGCGIAITALAIIRVLSKGSSSAAVRASQTALSASTLPVIAATVIPSSLSVGYLIWTSMACERKFEQRERQRERWEMQNFPDGEFSEMVAIYKGQGLSSEDAEAVVRIFSKDDEVFLNLMMVEELGYSRFGLPTEKDVLWRASIPAIISHGMCIAAPLIPLLKQHTAAVELGESAVVVQALGLSILQSKLLYGAYADIRSTVPILVGNAMWLGTLYVVTRYASKLLIATCAAPK